MRHFGAALVGILLAVPLAVGPVKAQSAASAWDPSSRIGQLKQISPGVGGVIADSRLLWTNNDGGVWTDITPPGTSTEALAGFYALDARRIWAVMVVPSDEWTGRWANRYPLRLLHTSNGGRTWRQLRFNDALFPRLKTAGADPTVPLFVDAKHGWFLWRIPTGTQVSAGILLSTRNGGRTWTELPGPPSAHEFSFSTATEGWGLGSPGGDELWATHDAGRTWTQKRVSPPDDCKECQSLYDIPRFRNPMEGVVAVTFSDNSSAEEARFVCANYVTHDGGNSWQIIDEFEENAWYPDQIGSISETDMGVVRVFSNQEHGMRIRTAAGAISPRYPAGLPPRGSIRLIDFVDASHGWLVYSESILLSTSDGGHTFKVILPTPNLSR